MNKLLFLGDICTDCYQDKDIIEFKKTDLYKFLENYDGEIIGNLESPILKNNIFENLNKFSLLNKPSLFEMYDYCNIFTLANNHIFDQGFDGFKETISYLRSNNKKYFGADENINLARKPLFLSFKNLRIALLGYNCYSTNSEHNANRSAYGCSPLIYDYVIEDIKKAKEKGSDYVFILPHWGIENEFYPTVEQVAFARNLIESGADGIIGSHTHTIQAFELFKGKPIYYSLGNFLFNNFKINNQDTYLQHKYNKEGMLVEMIIDNNQIQINEYFVKFNKNMIPEFSSIDKLETKILENNELLKQKTLKLMHKKVNTNLSISLKFNGNIMQLVYDDKSLINNNKIKYEKIKTRIKRIILKKIKKFL